MFTPLWVPLGLCCRSVWALASQGGMNKVSLFLPSNLNAFPWCVPSKLSSLTILAAFPWRNLMVLPQLALSLWLLPTPDFKDTSDVFSLHSCLSYRYPATRSALVSVLRCSYRGRLWKELNAHQSFWCTAIPGAPIECLWKIARHFYKWLVRLDTQDCFNY